MRYKYNIMTDSDEVTVKQVCAFLGHKYERLNLESFIQVHHTWMIYDGIDGWDFKVHHWDTDNGIDFIDESGKSGIECILQFKKLWGDSSLTILSFRHWKDLFNGIMDDGELDIDYETSLKYLILTQNIEDQ